MPNVKATKTSQKRLDAALEAFHNYYTAVWGYERWHESLFPALSKPTRYCALINQFVNSEGNRSTLAPDEADQALEMWLGKSISEPLVLIRKSDRPFPRPITVARANDDGDKLMSHWSLDYASVIAACMLQVNPGDNVLDLCAAPGGKSIVLTQLLWPELHAQKRIDTAHLATGTECSCLHSNEDDHGRYKRLTSNIQAYVPSQLLAEKAVRVLNLDGSQKSAVKELPFGEEGYDKILLDAPCSSERHIIHAHLSALTAGKISEEISNWKSSHAKTLAKTQLALLLTALKAVKISGYVLYATCSVSNEENDEVIARALDAARRERKKDPNINWRVQVDDMMKDDESRTMLDSLTEPTTYGRIVLPDHPLGERWGPLYLCRLQKVQARSRNSKEGSYVREVVE